MSYYNFISSKVVHFFMLFSELFYSLPTKFLIKLLDDPDYIFVDKNSSEIENYRKFANKHVKSITSFNKLVVYTLY